MMSGMTLTWPARGRPRGTVVLLHGLMARAATWWQIGPELVDRERTANPGWAEQDVANSIEGVAAADAPALSAALRAPLRADLPRLVRAAPVPLLVLAATRESALRGDRDAVRRLLPADRFVE